jgi:hypothetical protein
MIRITLRVLFTSISVINIKLPLSASMTILLCRCGFVQNDLLLVEAKTDRDAGASRTKRGPSSNSQINKGNRIAPRSDRRCTRATASPDLDARHPCEPKPDQRIRVPPPPPLKILLLPANNIHSCPLTRPRFIGDTSHATLCPRLKRKESDLHITHRYRDFSILE